MKKAIAIVLSTIPLLGHALPIDWHGKFGIDSSIVNNYRLIEGTAATAISDGSMEVTPASGNHETSSIQSYVFSLRPEMIINDAATFKAEITTGYGKGGVLGTNNTTSQSSNNSNVLYLNNEADGSNNLTMSQFYLELYSDIATYKVGRHTKQWGLGAIYSDGNKLWDRHTFAYDGVTMNFKLNNFYIAPFWARVASGPELTRISHTKEWGLSMLYDNIDRDFALGVLYAKKQNGSQATAFSGLAGNSLGTNNVKVLDIYFKSKWNNFSLELEAPIISGELGYFYNATTFSDYKASAILFKTRYIWNDRLTIGIDGGTISGDDPNKDSEFGALYLNPNYKIATILFGYNLMAVSDPANQSYFDAYVTNAKYISLRANYLSGKWNWDGALIYAKANEVAHAGKKAFNHLKGKLFNATVDQADDLGIEIDLNGTYHWNNEISLNMNMGYLMAGDYFAYTNDASKKNSAANVWSLQMGLGVEF